MLSLTIHYADGDTVQTQFNGTADDATAYYVGQTFNIGSVDDNMQRCVSITIHNLKTSDPDVTLQQCTECHATIPASGPMQSPAHLSSCSLHPDAEQVKQ